MEQSTRKIRINTEELVERAPAYITTFHEFGQFIVADSPQTLGHTVEGEVEFFISTSEEMLDYQVKVLIPVEETFYHFFMDSLPLLLKLYNQDPSLMFVLYLQKARPNPSYKKFLALLFRILDGMKIRYKTISTIVGFDYAPTYQFSNYIIVDNKNFNMHEYVTFVDIQYAVDIAFKYSCDATELEGQPDPPPFRKVYLTRGGKGGDLGPIDRNYEFYKDDLRMYDEYKLEKFFSDRGYEVVEPETRFDSIMEQMVYMKEVKTLVAVTCSGLVNMIFMQPDQLVIELQAELVQVNVHAKYLDSGEIIPIQNLHNFYQPLSFMGGHTYIGIPSNRDPDVVIEKLSKDAISYLL
jgi:hypothetical protein